jgi:hypothetical protein
VNNGASILARGGDGGDTFNKANQVISPGLDGNPGTNDDVVVGLVPGAVPSGSGAPGGGGSGGGVVLISKGNLTVAGTINTSGGAGGTSGNANRDGGAGGGGRILLMCVPPCTVDTTGSTLTGGTLGVGGWTPTVDLASVGQSQWFDLELPTVDFNPGGTNPPFSTDNFAELTRPLPPVDTGQWGLVQGVDFDAVLEFQGAADLNPLPTVGGPPPSTSLGLTPWSTSVDSIDNKRFVRFRWRFFARDGYVGANPANPNAPLPRVDDVTIPFKK